MGGPAAVVGQKRGLYLRLVTGGMGQLIRQDKTRQDKTRQDKIRQEKTIPQGRIRDARTGG